MHRGMGKVKVKGRKRQKRRRSMMKDAGEKASGADSRNSDYLHVLPPIVHVGRDSCVLPQVIEAHKDR